MPTLQAYEKQTATSPGDWHDGLETLRGVAALMVVLFHCIGLLPWSVTGTPFAIFSAGWVGVDLFFVISGFVITASALRQKDTAGYARHFWRARFARILPLYYFTLVAFLLVHGAQVLEKDPVLQLVSHLLLFHNLFQETAFSINGVTWSLGVEMQLYVIAFLTVPLMAGAGRRALIAGYVSLLALVLGYRIVVWLWLRSETANDAAISHALSQVPALIDSFALGGLVRLLGGMQPSRLRCVVLSVLAVCLYLVIYAIYSTYADRYWALWPMAFFFRSFVAATAGVALCAAVSSRPRAASGWKPLLRLGKISYGIYLWHLIVLYFVQRDVPLKGAAAVALILAATIILAELSYRYIEQPVMRWARDRSQAA